MKIILFFVSLSIIVGSVAFSQTTTYRWKAVPGASFYQGYVKNINGSHLFRTTGTKLFFSEGTDLKINAYRGENRIIGGVKVNVDGAAPVQVKAPAKVEPKPEPPPKEEPPRTDLAEEDYGDDDYKDEEISAKKEEPPAEAVPKPEPAAEEAAMSGAEKIYPPTIKSVFANQAFGQDTLKAKGGASSLNTKVGIGKVTIGGGLDLNPRETPWKIDGSIGIYQFSAKIKEEVEGVRSAEKEETKNALCFDLLVLGFTPLGLGFGTGKSPLEGGAGFVYTKMPVLKVKDRNTGAAELTSAAAFGPAFALRLLNRLDEKNTYGGQFTLMPIGLGSGVQMAGTRMVTLGGIWRYLFYGNIYAEGGLKVEKNAFALKVECPSGSADCKTTSTSDIFILQGSIGVGTSF